MNCPSNHGEMRIVRTPETIVFRGNQLQFFGEHYVCPNCGLSVDDLILATQNQKAISDAYRRLNNLLTGEEILEGRKQKGWSQGDLSRAINVGIASVKRWESGQVQTRPMDDALRRAFRDGVQYCSPYAGNRPFSLTRIKLVLETFSQKLGRKLLRKRDRLLYSAKYLWYADMLAFRQLGQGMTGAAYARLPKGPQLNNYSDLIDLILEADTAMAEPLTDQEEMIIKKISKSFPTNAKVYKAAHEEPIWKDRSNGEPIPYSDAEHLKGV